VPTIRNLEDKNELLPVNPNTFIGYPYMIAIMAVLQVLTVIYGNRDFVFLGFDASAGWLFLMPIMLYTFQIVSECYGWQYSRQMIWLNVIVNALFTTIILAFRFIPNSTGIVHSNLQNAYIILMNPKYVAGTMMMVAVFAADFVTSALMCWSRLHWHGKNVILRMVILHVVSETIIISTGFIVDPFRGYSIQDTWGFAKDSFLACSIIMLGLLPFVRYAIWYIQHRVEGVVVFDYKIDFRVFKFKALANDTLQFNSYKWDQLPDNVKQNFDFARAMLISQSRSAIYNMNLK
jgi:hypothetical protein